MAGEDYSYSEYSRRPGRGPSSSSHSSGQDRRVPPPSRTNGSVARKDSGYDSRRDDLLGRKSGRGAAVGGGVPPRSMSASRTPASSGMARHRSPSAQGGHSSREYDDYGDDEEQKYQDNMREVRRIQQESLRSSREAVRRLRETEDVAQNSLTKLGQQSEQLGKIDNRLVNAQYHATASEAKATDLKRLNNNFIVSTFSIANPFNKAKRREKELAKEMARRQTIEDSNIRMTEESLMSQRNVSTTISKYGKKPLDGQNYGGGGRSRKNFMADEDEDLDAEKEIDENIDIITSSVSRLKMMAVGMQSELHRQNDQLSRIDLKTDDVHDSVKRTDIKVKKMLN